MFLIELNIASPVQLVINSISYPERSLYGRLLRARRKSGKPDAPQDTNEP